MNGKKRRARHGLQRLGTCLVAAHTFMAAASAAREAVEGDAGLLGAALPDTEAPSSEMPVEMHGFVSQGFILTARNEYLAKSKQGSLELSEVGLNFTKQLTTDLRTGVQLFAHDLGPFGNYAPQFDWYYLDFQAWDWLGFRVGRTKMPFGLYNEINDIDVARIPILLPQSLYPVDHREFLFAQTGGEIYGNVRLGDAGALEYRVHGGTLSADLPGAPPPPGVNVLSLDVPYVYGGRVSWSPPVTGLTLGMSGQVVRFDAVYGFDPQVQAVLEAIGLLPITPPGTPLPLKFRVSRWIASLSYTAHDWDVSAEYSRWLGEFESRAPLLFPPETVNERYYVMLAYRVNSWFTPCVYYSGYYPNVERRSGRAAYQHDISLTTRYDLGSHLLMKLEGHLIQGTAGLDNRLLNGGVEPPNLTATWGAFLAKMTAYF